MLLGGCGSQPVQEMGGPQSHIKVDQNVQNKFNKAVKLLQKEKYDEAIVVLEQLVKLEERLAAPYLNLGMAYSRKGELKTAEEQLLKAIKLVPQDSGANNELGILYRKMGRFEEARKAYETVLAHDKQHLPARKNLGILCEIYLRDLQCALEHFESYLQYVPDDKEIGIWIASLKNRIGR